MTNQIITTSDPAGGYICNEKGKPSLLMVEVLFRHTCLSLFSEKNKIQNLKQEVYRAYNEMISPCYLSRGRNFHNLENIAFVLNNFWQKGIHHQCNFPFEVSLSVFFHDLIIVKKNAKALNAYFAKEFVKKFSGTKKEQYRIEKNVLATSFDFLSFLGDNSIDERMSSDLSRLFFAKSNKLFKIDCKKIIIENGGGSNFMHERRELQRLFSELLERDIFKTEIFKLLYENQARNNMLEFVRS